MTVTITYNGRSESHRGISQQLANRVISTLSNGGMLVKVDVEADPTVSDPEACPGCGCLPGDGRTANCFHPDGCGYFDTVKK